jgi:predicted nucleic acid-binding protein
MTGEVVVDTNVLIYAYGGGDRGKQMKALELLDRLVRGRRCVLPAQVLAEFFVVSVRKGVPPFTAEQAGDRIEALCQVCRVIDLSSQIVQEAVRGVVSHILSYWDAQIWAAARLNQIPIVVSEDFSHGSRVGGVTFLNPFHPDFDIGDL